MKNTTPAETRIFHYDTQGRLIAETDATGATLVEYIYLNDKPLAMVQPTDTPYYYHTDHINTPRVMTNSSGNAAWKAAYHAFGYAEVDASSTITNNIRFPGQYYDSETNLHYNWNRYYDPRTGRYLTPDPIGLAGGIDPYVYTENDPVNRVDREGLASCTYSISRHTLTCSSNEGPSDALRLGPSGVYSGLGNCRNVNTDQCTGNKNIGSIPKGDYKINRDDRPGHDKYWRLEPVPKVSWWAYYLGGKRGGFMLHPGSHSLGCITVDLRNANAMLQYNVINQLLRSEDGNNHLKVEP